MNLSQKLPKSLTFSSGFKSLVRNATQLDTFEGVHPEFLQALNVHFGFCLSYLSMIQDCQIRVFAGQQPSSADDDEGTECLVILEKTSQEVLIEDDIVTMRVVMNGTALDSGMASWVRVYRKRLGEIETANRFDGSIVYSRDPRGFVYMPNVCIQRPSEVTITLNAILPDSHRFQENKL